MDSSNFLSWFKKLFYPCCQAHERHWPSISLLRRALFTHQPRVARHHNIRLFCLPPNCTHIVQPLDVGAFGPVKKAWASILKRWKLETRGLQVSKEAFPGLIAQLWETTLQAAHCRGGFRGSGIFPLSREVVLKKVAPSMAFHHAGERESEEDEEPDIHHITCKECGHQMRSSPLIRTHLKGYFKGILEFKEKPSRRRNNFKIRIEGEAITSDEFVELLEEKQQQQQQKPSRKGKGKGQKEPQVDTSDAADLSEVETEESDGKIYFGIFYNSISLDHHFSLYYQMEMRTMYAQNVRPTTGRRKKKIERSG